ncbi:unnamed protein product [Closterium sp. Naga37s-1]|nr:unnamed protein product [Closterium sp. Naga37s-1]
MGILAFEVAGLMHRVLDLWSQLEPGHVAELRQQLQSENLERLGVGDFTFRWRMAGLEYSNELLLLTAGVAALARQSGGAVGGQVQQVLRAHARRREKREKAGGKAEADEVMRGEGGVKGKVNVGGAVWGQVQQVLRAHARRREEREKVVGKAETDEVMRFLRDHLGPTGILKREMEALDEAIASTSSDGDAYSFEDMRPTQTYPEEYFVTQGQKVQQLQRSSLWSHSLERMAKTLAVAVGILWQHLREVYGWPDPIGPDDLEGTVGQAGLPMLYARVLAAVSQLAVTMPGTPAFTDKRQAGLPCPAHAVCACAGCCQSAGCHHAWHTRFHLQELSGKAVVGSRIIRFGDLEGTVGQAGLPMLYARVLAAATMPGTPGFANKWFDLQEAPSGRLFPSTSHAPPSLPSPKHPPRKDLYLILPTFIRHQLHSRLRVSRRRPLDEVLLGELRQLAAQMFCWLMPFSQATLQWVNDRSHSARVAGRQRVLLVQVGVRIGGTWEGPQVASWQRRCSAGSCPSARPPCSGSMIALTVPGWRGDSACCWCRWVVLCCWWVSYRCRPSISPTRFCFFFPRITPPLFPSTPSAPAADPPFCQQGIVSNPFSSSSSSHPSSLPILLPPLLSSLSLPLHPPPQTLHFANKDRFEAILIELLSSLSLVIAASTPPPPPPPVRARPSKPPSLARASSTSQAPSRAKAFGLGSTASYSSRRRSSPAPVSSGSPLDNFDPEAALAEGAAEAAAAAAAAAAAGEGGRSVPSRIAMPCAASAAEVLDAPTSSISPPPSAAAVAAASAESSSHLTAAAASTAAGQPKQQRRAGGAAVSTAAPSAAPSAAAAAAAAAGSPVDEHAAFLSALPRRRQTHADIAAAAIAAVDADAAAAAGSAGASSTPPKPTAAGKPPMRRRGRHSRSLSMSDIMPSPSSLTWLVDDSAAAGNGPAGGGGGGMGGGADSLPKFLEELAQHGFVVSAFDRSEGRVLHQAAPLSSALAAPAHPSSSSSLFHNPPGRLFSPDGLGRASGEEGKRGGTEGRNDKDMSPLDRLLARMPPPRRLQRSTTPPGTRIERAMSPLSDRRRESGSAANGTGGVGDGGSGRSGSSRFSSSSSVAMEGAEGGCDRRGSECGSGNGIVSEDKKGLNERMGGESSQSCESTHKSQEGAVASAAPKKDKFGNPLPPQDALAVG